MVHCSNCGAKLTGSKIFCPKCHFRHNPTQLDQLELKARLTGKSVDEKSEPSGKRKDVREERPEPSGRRQEVREEDPQEEPQQERQVMRPRGYGAPSTYTAAVAHEPTIERSEKIGNVKVNIVKGKCSYCEVAADERCFFCMAPACSRHLGKMKIFVRDNPFGSAVKACPRCQSEKHGQNPTEKDAQKASMFFNVKPYHEWRVI